MPLKLKHLPAEVAGRLRGYHRRKRLYQFVRITLMSAVAYAVLVLLAAHVDRFLFLDESVRMAIFWGIHGAWGLLTLGLLGWFALQRSSVARTAYELESRLTDRPSPERYVTLDNVLARGGYEDDPVARELVRQLREATVEQSRGVRVGRLVRDRKMVGFLGAFVAVLGVYGLLTIPGGYQFPLMIERTLFPHRNLPKPSFIQIQVRPESLVRGAGEEAVIEAEISGEIPALLRWFMDLLGMTTNRATVALRPQAEGAFDFRSAEQADMSRLQRDLFLLSRGNLQESFQYRIRCGDAETKVHLVRVVQQPRITDVALRVTYPEYTKLDPNTITDVSKPLRLLENSRIELTFRTDQEVAQQILRIEGREEPVRPDWDPDTRTGTWAFDLKKKVALEIVVTNPEGFANVERTRLTLDILEDRAPTIRLEYPPPGDQHRVASEIIPFRAFVEDDLGVQELAFEFFVNPDRDTDPKQVPVEIEKVGEQTYELTPMFDLEKTRTVPGDLVQIRLRARDTANNDGFSRDVFVRIVPFTRGENERKRLVSLAWLRTALAGMAVPPKDPAASAPASQPAAATRAMDLPADPYAAAATAATNAGILLSETPSVHSLLTVLEREVHFTDAARHKNDVRKLHVLLREAAAPVTPPAFTDVRAYRDARLLEITNDLLPGLTQYRHLKNMMWRLFGMQYEAATIQAKLQALADQDPPDAALVQSAKKRGELYFKTLQDLGEELIELSRVCDALDPNEISEAVGEMNLQGYYLRSPAASLGRRIASCDGVATAISVMLEKSRKALPALCARELAARSRLDAMYGAVLATVTLPPDGQLRTAWAANAVPLLDDDRRLMQWSPMLPLWERFTNLALSQRLADALSATTDTARKEASAQLAKLPPDVLSPPGDLAKQIARDRAAMAAMAFDYELATLLAIQDISETEKAFEKALIEIEEAQANGALSDADRQKRFAAVLALDLHAELPKVSPDRSSRDTDAIARFRTNCEVLGGAARLRLAFPEPVRLAQQLQERTQGMGAQMVGAEKALRGGLTPDNARTLLAALDGLEASTAAIRRDLDRLNFQVSFLRDQSTSDEDELMVLKLREAFHRYAGRTADPLAKLRALDPESPDPAALTLLDQEFNTLATQSAVLGDMIARALQERTSPPTEGEAARPGRSFVRIDDLRRTRAYLQATTDLLAGKDPRQTAGQFIERFPAAGVSYLAARAELIEAARATLRAGDTLLQSESPDGAAFDTQVAGTLEHLDRMLVVVANAGAGELQAALAERIGTVGGKIRRLAFAGAPVTPQAVSVRRFALGQAVKDLESAVNELDAAARSLEPDAGGWFKGGPGGLFAGPLQLDVDVTRARLIDQYRFGDGRVVEGVLEGLAASPDRARYADGYAWSEYLYRVVRSDLFGIGASEHATDPNQQPVDASLVKWLEAEVQKAMLVKLKFYGDAGLEYLKSVKDELRR